MYTLRKKWRAPQSFTYSGTERITIHDTDSGTVIVVPCPAKDFGQYTEWKLVGQTLSLHDHVEVRRSHNWLSGSATDRGHDRFDRGIRWSLTAVDNLPVFGESDVAEKFESLVAEWRNDTLLLSSMSRKLMHPAYLRIIGLGPVVLPLLLRELEERPSYWFSALSAISGSDPVPDSASFDEAVEIWLAWGREQSIL
jgi:hypothetical protein